MPDQPTASKAHKQKSLLRNALLMVSGVALLVSLLFIGVMSPISQRHVERRSLGQLNELMESMSVMASIACSWP